MTTAETEPRSATTTVQTPGPEASWWAVGALALGIFTLVTAEFLPASLLSPMASDLGVSEGMAGQTVTATAVMGAITAPTLALLLPRVDRRTVMIGLTALALLSNLLVAVSPGLVTVLLARLLLGVALAGFWAMVLAVTAQLVPADHLGRAMMVVNSGVSLATVLAVPVGAFLGEQWGWRWVFVAAGATAVVALVAQLVTLPRLPVAVSGSLRVLLETARRRIVILGMVATALVAGGHFAGFTYLRPALDRVPALTATGLAVLLAAYGVASFVGNLASGLLADRRLRLVVVAAPALIGVATVTLALAGTSYTATGAAVVVWGIAFGAIPTAIQTWIARVAPDRLESIGGLFVATFQVAIALGAAVGGLVVDAFDVRTALVVGGVAAVLGGALLGSARRV
ncbi:MFS transporter [Mumia sp. DW29H23]|uniref:MFS transporter n=1 Tax=Mumia sp. DW29H23 TaxID=3421241 RepID=UPI003D69ED84